MKGGVLMQIRLIMERNNIREPITLPLQYNHLVQGMIYHNIDEELAEFLHNKGYIHNKRHFKMFNFSRLMGQFRINRQQKTITFLSDIELYISSPIDNFCQSFGNFLLKKGQIHIGNNDLVIKQIQFIPTHTDSKDVLVKTLSPVVVYSTLLKPEGGKYTCYFMPREPMFQSLIIENLKNKWQAFYNSTPLEEEFKIYPVGNYKQNLVIYKDTVIKGASGLFRLQGNSNFISFALGVGLGGKGSQGFSCLKLIKERG